LNDYIEDTSVRLIIDLGVGYSAEKEKGEAILKPLRLARRFLLVFIVVLVVVFPFLIFSAHAAEPSLTSILNYLGFTNRALSSVQTFSAGTYNFTLYAEFAGYYNQNNLSYYQVGTSVYDVIFTGPEGANGYVTPPITKTFTINYQFGLSFATPENHRYWTEYTRTPNDGVDHCKIYENLDVPGMYLIGWENTWGGGDKDYNDMVLSLCPQYQVTFNQTGVSTDFTGNVVTIDGTGYTCANLPKSFWWNKYSSHSFSFASPLVVNSGKRYVWNSTSGLSTLQSGTLTVTSSGSVTGNYKTQYCLTVNTNPAEVLTLNPSAVSGQGWYYSGTTATVDAVQVVSKVAGQSRYDFRSWTGATPTGVGNKATVLMNGPKTATANYQLQYNITFCQTGVGSDFSGTVVSIDSTNYNRAALPVSFWWDNGTSHNFAFQSPLVVTSNAKQYVWNTTSGLSSSQSGSITVSTSGSVTGNYKTQYYLTVDNGGHGTATGQGWYYAGSSASFSISPTTVPGGTGIQYVFTGWVGSGTGSYTGPDVSHSVTMNNPITETAQWKTQYKLTVVSAHDSPVPSVGEHWYDSGTPITASVTSPADESGGTRYRCTGWTGTGSVPSSGTGTSTSFNINQASNITWNWIAQYYLTVTSPYGTTGGQGWYDNGATAYATLNTSVIDHGNGTRRIFVRWNGDASGTNYAQSNSILMNGPKTATAVWKTQYKLTVRTSGLGTKVTNVYNGSTILGTATDATPYTGWFDQNAVIQLNIDSPINGNPMKYVFIQWTGDASGSDRPTPVTMNLPKDITANYKTQYEVTFTQSGLDSSAAGTVVTVNGTAKTFGQLPYVFWVDNGTVITYSYSNVSSSTPGKRFILTGVTGPASPITVTSSVTVTGNYKIQYQITVTASPSGALGGTFKVTYTQCGTVYTNVQKTTTWTEWVDASTTVTVSQPQDTINGLSGTRYKFDHYDPSASVTMDQTKTITLVYKTQYYLTVTSAHDTPIPSSGWFDAGTPISASVTSPAEESGGTRYRCTGWTGTGSVPSSGTGTSASFTINQPSSITWNWIAQYYLTVTSPYDTPTPPSGWFDTGTPITASVTSPVSGPAGTRYVCTGWTGTGSVPASGTSKTVSFTITQPSSITWKWKTQYLLTVSTDPAGLSPQPTRNPAGEAGVGGWWYDNSTSVQLKAEKVSGYDFLNWDVDGSTVSGDTITVPMNRPHAATAHYQKIPIPGVGGYALPINLDLGTSDSLIPQIGLASVLSAIVAATIILVRRRKYTLRQEH